jgi:DNA-binding beta-propeller fold protein YncE
MRALAALVLLSSLPTLTSILLACDRSSVLVTTIAGGGGSFLGATPLTSSLSSPSGLAASPSGLLFIADTGSNAIRAMNLTSSLWLTGGWSIAAALPAGSVEGALNTTARFNAPKGVVYNPCTSQVYVADTGNAVVRVITPTASRVNTSLVAGQYLITGASDGVGSSATLNAPLGLALSPSCTLLYIADSGSNTVRRINITSRAVLTLAGSGGGGSINGVGTNAQFYQPQQLAIDATGLLLTFGNFVSAASCPCIACMAHSAAAPPAHSLSLSPHPLAVWL